MGFPYDESGWCFTEATMSALVKAPGQRLDLAQLGTVQQYADSELSTQLPSF